MITILNESNQQIQNPNYDLGYLTKVSDGIFMYHLFTEQQLAARQIDIIKQQLKETEEQAIAYADELISAEDYAEMKSQRAAWRAEINRLEAIVNS